MDDDAQDQATTHRTFDWVSLPLEIRVMVLELLLQHRGFGTYASVCREWQSVIEKTNFRRLKLRVSCLDDFQYMVRRQRALVKHIWLNIELREYTCRSCKIVESFSWMLSNDFIIKEAISKLFSILSTWSPVSDDLTLELSAQSASDSEHWFKNCYFGSHGENEGSEARLPEFHDGQHGWFYGRQRTAPPANAVSRLCEEVRLGFREELLPHVYAVTRFVLRRQCRRRFVPATLSLLLDKLPCLESLVLEPWQAWDACQQGMYDKQYQIMVETRLPQGLKRISIFEDFNEYYTTIFQRVLRQGKTKLRAAPVRITQPVLGGTFARRSLNLEQLSVSFMIDACHFFQARQPLWIWSHLQFLALTSRLLTSTATHKETFDMLEDAGIAALSMPMLQTMALWHGEKAEACVFLYRTNPSNTSLTWRGTWDLELEHRIIEVWEMVAATFTSSQLRVRKQLLQLDNNGSSHGDAIHQLDLPRGVIIDPVSLWQIRREGRNGWD